MLTLPKGKTLKVTGKFADGSATGDVFELTTSVAEMAPTLTIPAIVEMGRNTSHQGTGSLLQNIRYVGAVKPTGEKAFVDASGDYVAANDPRALAAKEGEVLIKQLTPTNAVAKYQVLNWDENVEGNRQVLTQYVASWVQVRRIRKELDVFKALITSAKAVQAKIVAATAGATTFAKGSHTETVDMSALDAAKAWDLFNEATLNFGKLGLPSAKEALNQGYLHTEGIADADILVFISKEFRQQLFKTPSLLASTSGFEAFRTAGIDYVNGIAVATTNNLPAGVHLVVVSTGMSGSFGLEQVGDGIGGNIVIDPNWSKAKRLDLWDEYALGTVYDFQVFVAAEAAALA